MYKKRVFNHSDLICNRIISEESSNERVLTRGQAFFKFSFQKVVQRRFHLNRNSR